MVLIEAAWILFFQLIPNDLTPLGGVHRTLTPHSTGVVQSHTYMYIPVRIIMRIQSYVTCARCWSLDLDPGLGTNKR